MSDRFLHLNDTNFPGVENVDPYRYHNNFDYYRWRGLVSFKLCNVKWNNDYADVPNWISDEIRDAWFDDLTGDVMPLETLFNSTPETEVKVPIPFNDAYNYNYIVIDMPIQTSENQPLDYEDENIRIKRWYYFVNDVIQNSPSTSTLVLTLDMWTMFINTVDIPYLMLERGHAPMSQITPEEYLFNPIENNEYLLASDFNYGTNTVVASGVYKPIGNGNKYILFAVPFDKADFNNLGGINYNGTSTPPTYANTSHERWGYQYQVNDYQWKFGVGDYSNASLPVKAFASNDGEVFNGFNIFAIEANLAMQFFTNLVAKHAHVMNAIYAVFMLSEEMFTINDTFTYDGYTLHKCGKKVNDEAISLTKNDFAFDSEYENITKLYTSPYSYLEITDDNGNSFNINIETTGRMRMRTEVDVMFPYLNYNILFSGINGNGSTTYTWRNINDFESSKSMWFDDFSKFMINWNIPTYALYENAMVDYSTTNYAPMQAAREGALVDYHNAVRFADVGYENTEDSLSTNVTNVSNSGNRNWDNVKRATATDVANIARTQIGLIANTNRQIQANNHIVDVLQHRGSPSATSELDNDGFVPKSAWINFAKVSDDADADWACIDAGTSAQIDNDIALAANNIGANIAGAGVAGIGAVVAFSNPISGGAAAAAAASTALVAGLGASAGASAVNGVSTGISTGLMITKNSSLAQVQKDQIEAKQLNAENQIKKLAAAQKTYDIGVKDENNDVALDNTKRFSDSLANDGINNKNADASKTASDENARLLMTTNNTNATNVYNTEKNNADWSRNAGIEAAKGNLEQKQREMAAKYASNLLGKPVTKGGSYSGDAMPDIWERRGIRINVRTQNKAAIKQTGDAFLRFGYALHRAWDMQYGFSYMKNFTYWKAEDVWINDGSGTAQNATSVIRDILLAGTTVWNDPAKIGTISIYDNWRDDE